uniref:ATP-binding cassette sub-family C member 2 n=1 Tax=Diaphorina citri TaxID=121845 RepID=A0A3R5VSD4_DIACI|nr:ATP-binding cassette sub-family C member 2 [Diaphorina citri]
MSAFVSSMAEDEDGMLPKLEPEIKLEAVSTPDVHAMASDVIHDGYAANDLDTMFDAQDQYPWKPPTTTVQYVPGRGVARYKSALKTLIPIRKNKKRKVIGVDSAGFLSFISYSWMNELMLSAYRKATITVNELPHCSPWDTCSYNSERLDKMWQEEVARKGPQDASLGGVVWRFIRTRILFATFIYSLYVAMGFASPAIFLRNLLVYSETPDAPTSDGIFWALCLILSEILRIVFVTWVWAMNYRTATRLRAACMGLLYKKVIRLNSLGNKSVGELINLFSNDSQRIYDMTLFAPLIAGGPLTLLLGGYYIYWLLSPWALSGILVFIIFYPVQYGLSKLTSHYRGKTYSTTDERIKIISEVISFIKLIKMYAWEKNFARKLDDTRRRELEYIKNTSYFQSLGLSIGPTAPVISAITSFVAHIASGNNLTASQGFSVLTVFLRCVSTILSYSQSLKNLRRGCVSLQNVKSILLMEEVNVYVSKPIDKSSAVSIAGGSFLWDTLLDSSKTSGSKRKKYAAKSKEKSNGEESTHLKAEDVERNIALVDINFFAPKGKLVGICGAVGSGKSALLYAILSQLRSTAGKLSREGTCAYVSQEAWITNDTLRHNILFGEPFEPQRYYKTLYNCALNTDIHILPGGDQTEIGERGINLSGGQKQRVALARALYSNRDIYVLDDPFSALDTEVASHIFRHCILDTLGSRTVILVSNQIQYLSKCSLIYVLKDGRIFESGTHDDLLSKNGEYFSLSSLGKLKVGSPDPMEGGEGKPPPNSNISYISPTAAVQNGKTGEQAEAKLTTIEDKVTGNISKDTLYAYIRATGGVCLTLVAALSVLINVGSTSFSSWWLAVWLKAGGGNITEVQGNETVTYHSDHINANPDFYMYQTVYASTIGIIILTSLLRSFIFTKVALKASHTLHAVLFKKMLYSPLSFFEETPSGRIQNYFTKDMFEVDSRLPYSLESSIQNMWSMLFAFLMICFVFPWFALPLLIITTLYHLISKVFRIAVRELKRMENVSRSPIFSNVSSTVSGLHIIHVFHKEQDFVRRFCEQYDENSTTLFLCSMAMRWLAVRIDVLAVIAMAIITGLTVAFHGSVSPALAGLALTYASHVTGLLQFTVRVFVETELNFLAVERINNCSKKLVPEGRGPITSEFGQVKVKLADWPRQGTIKFKNVSLRYRDNWPLVLANVSFRINHGENIGIVGRTGAGKSSLLVALFRLVELSSGQIKIDDFDIASVELETLRSRLSVIPQDPVLFNGTIRYNLDPFGRCHDTELWDALEKSHLKSKVVTMRSKLDSDVQGDQLSLGEKQLLCLARALLRKTKILVLDEATASIDPETEMAIQSTIHLELRHCTVLLIAHRLSTVTSCDKVLVMDNGQVSEFDTPGNLLANPNTKFSQLMAAAQNNRGNVPL